MAEDGDGESAEPEVQSPEGLDSPGDRDSPSVDGPRVEIPSVDVPGIDVPGADGDDPGDAGNPGDVGDPSDSLAAVDVGDSEIAALFVRHVLVWNAVLLAFTLGGLLIVFRSDWTTGSRLIAVGVVLSLYGAYRWPDPDGPGDGDADADADGDLVDPDEGPG